MSVKSRVKWIAAAGVAGALAVGATQALAHAPVVHQGPVITWTHADHCGDAIGCATFAQAPPLPPFALGITKAITTTNRIYKFRSRYPQVGTIPNPPTWNSAGSLIIPDRNGVEWWYTRAASSVPGGPSGIALYLTRRFPGGGLGFAPPFAIVTPRDASLLHPLDADSPTQPVKPLPRPTVITDNIPADFIR